MATLEKSGGSGKRIEIIGDTNSDTVREVVAQLNQAELPVMNRFAAIADGATSRIPIGLWRYDAWIRDIFFVNDNGANALTNAATDMALIKYAAAAIDLTAAGTYLFRVEGFDAGNFPAKTALFANQFVASTNCTARTGRDQGIYVKAGEMLALEFINNEGAARNLIVGVTMVMTDRIDLDPGRLQVNVARPTQQFRSRTRASN